VRSAVFGRANLRLRQSVPVRRDEVNAGQISPLSAFEGGEISVSRGSAV